ncbi:MAG: ketose-bisphosphate aldolase [Candidatus Limiplasma sp.]|nr:ketose-bisphosphate aldolase [Candidatus Limiplasma sp.]
MYRYQELGLHNVTAMFEKAYQGGYAVPALNFVSIEQFNAIIDAAKENRSPVILLASPNLHRQLGAEILARIAQAGADRLAHEGAGDVPLALHLDHGMTYDQCVHAIETGFSSVMIDGSALPFEENIALTRKVVDYAHAAGVTVEGELGVLTGAEEEGGEGHGLASQYTDPALVQQFVQETGVDCLAISIGTSHGLVKMKPKADGTLPELRFDILEEVQRRLPGFPIVLHGSSSIPAKYVDMINQYGGHLEQTIGIPEEQVARAAKMAVCKVNIASDGWISALALTRKILAENPAAIDSRVFTLKVRPELAELYAHKMRVLGSVNKA